MLSTIHLHVLLHHHGFNGGKITQKNNFDPVKSLFYTLNDRFHTPYITFKHSHYLFTAI